MLQLISLFFYYYCSGCKNLTSLKGCPEKVGRDFQCYGCEKLTSLEGCPEKVGGDFDCSDCGIKFTEDDIEKVCTISGEIFC